MKPGQKAGHTIQRQEQSQAMLAGERVRGVGIKEVADPAPQTPLLSPLSLSPPLPPPPVTHFSFQNQDLCKKTSIY